MKKCIFLRGFLAALVVMIVGYVVHMVGAIVGMSYYMDEAYFGVWSKVMMPEAGPPPWQFTVLSLVFGFVVGVILVMVYDWIKGSLGGKNVWQKGLRYGFLIFMVAGIPMYLSLYLLINLPVGLLWLWIGEGLVLNLLSGLVVVKIMK